MGEGFLEEAGVNRSRRGDQPDFFDPFEFILNILHCFFRDVEDGNLYPLLKRFIVIMGGHAGDDDEVCTGLLQNLCTSNQLVQRAWPLALDGQVRSGIFGLLSMRILRWSWSFLAFVPLTIFVKRSMVASGPIPSKNTNNFLGHFYPFG